MTSLPPSSKTFIAASMFARTLRCDSITPFGMPVLPLEKITVASESTSFSGTNRRLSAAAGRTAAATAIAALAAAGVSASRSSRKTMPGISSSPALARNVRDVRIVRMPVRSIAAAIASRPTVKFRLTGTRPAIDVAMLASAPATEAGSRSPTSRSPTVRLRTIRASNRLPTRARPNVSSRPVESAMHSAERRAFATRTNARPSVSMWLRLYRVTLNDRVGSNYYAWVQLISVFQEELMLKRYMSAAVLALVAVAPLVAQQAPKGWKLRVDRSTSASDPDAAGNIKFVTMGQGFHATNPQAAI